MTAAIAKTKPTLLSEIPATASTERAEEFLACAKTALKIGKNQHKNDPNPPPPNAWWLVSPSDLRLLEPAQQNTRQAEILEDGLALLRTMEIELKQLESLVRRRGQTNDPTQAIAASTRRLEEDTKELTTWLPTIIPPTIRRNGQAYKHYSMIQEWFQQAANEQGKRLQEILKVRGKVLAEQTRRRKQFQATSEARTGSSRKATTNDVNNNPLFQLAPPTPTVKSANSVNGTASEDASRTNGSSAPTASPASAPRPTGSRSFARPPSAGGYPYYAAKPGVGYGASSSSSSYTIPTAGGYGGSGMRQRRAAAASTTDSAVAQQQNEQTLLLQRQQERQTQQRLREAREAEKGLASLVGLFGKMSVSVHGEMAFEDEGSSSLSNFLFSLFRL